MIVAR